MSGVACREDNDENEETTKPGLPVPTVEIVEAVQHVLGLKPPPKLAGAVQKLINCCPEAQAALQAQVWHCAGQYMSQQLRSVSIAVHALLLEAAAPLECTQGTAQCVPC